MFFYQEVEGNKEHTISTESEFSENYSKHVPMGRMMNRNELIGLIEYLCSDKSTYTTCSIITVDGGNIAASLR